MAIHKLTAREIAKAEDGMHGDGGGLWLQVRNGNKSWLFRWTEPKVGGVRGRDRNMGLGSVAKGVDVIEARKRAKAQWLLIEQGLDPIKVRDDGKLQQAIDTGRVKTFNEVADEWFEAKIARRSRARRRAVENALSFARAAIGRRPIQTIDSATILKEVGLQTLWYEIPPTAQEMMSCLRRIFSYAISHKYFVGPNPAEWADNLEHALEPFADVHTVTHQPALKSYKEIGRFMEVLRSHRSEIGAPRLGLRKREDRSTMNLLFEYIVLTACRISEAANATWDHIDDKHKVWTVPAMRADGEAGHKMGKKTKHPILRPISSAMQSVLEEMRHRRHATTDLIFPSEQTRHSGASRPYSVTAFQKFLNRSLKWPYHLTSHGFRSTFTDWARASGYPEELYDLQAGHSVGKKVAQAYRRDQLVDQRRQMMEHWAYYCSQPAPEELSAPPIKLIEHKKEIENESY